MRTRYQTPSTRHQVLGTRHTLFHHIFMVVLEESINIVWLFAALLFALGGYVIFAFSTTAFLKIAGGLPIFLMGVSVAIFKIHEISLTLFRPDRLKNLCVFCRENE